jgi:hypothetical protein
MRFVKNKTVLVLVFLSLLSAVSAQITVKTNLIHAVSLGRVLAFDLKIEKSGISGFTRLDIRHSSAIKLEGLETSAAQVLASDSLTSLVWELSPNDTFINLRLKLLPIVTPGRYPLVFFYHYQKEDVKIDFESHPFTLVAKDTALPVFLSSSWETIRSLQEPAIPMPAVRAEKVIQKSPAEVEQQVAQLKRDSREAQKVGELEKERVAAKLDTINIQMAALGDTAASPDKIELYLDLKKQLIKAEEEMKVAERVLILAKNLDTQANEIQRISKEQMAQATAKASVKPTQTAAQSQQPAATQKPATTNVAEPAIAVTEKPAETDQKSRSVLSSESESAAKPVEPSATKTETLETEKDITFYVQVGSFVENPDMSILNKAGDVHIVKEGSVFKALSGKYTSVNDAAKRKSELAGSFPDCFVVAYKEGKRVK